MIDCIKAVCSFEMYLTGVNDISDYDGGLVVILILRPVQWLNFKVLKSVFYIVKVSSQEAFSG